jgi:hypothetical protein
MTKREIVAAGVADAQLSLEEAFAFIDECDTDIFAEATALLSAGGGDTTPSAAVLALAVPSATSKAVVAVAAVSPGPMRVKKKRVRRQKLELEYLRKLVVELEDKLTQLKRVTGAAGIRAARSSPTATTSSEDDEDESFEESVAASSPVSAATTCEATSPMKDEPGTPSSVATLWMGVAERQYKERLRAEHQNQKLKTMLEAQIKLANSLEKLLTKRPSEEVKGGCQHPLCEESIPLLTVVYGRQAIESVSTTKRVKRHWELTTDNDAAIFEQQLADVARAHLQVNEVFSAPEFRSLGTTFHDTRVKNDAASDGDGVGTSYEFVSSATLPFNLKTASNAFWRMMAFESIKKHTYYQRVRALSSWAWI